MYIAAVGSFGSSGVRRCLLYSTWYEDHRGCGWFRSYSLLHTSAFRLAELLSHCDYSRTVYVLQRVHKVKRVVPLFLDLDGLYISALS